MPEPKQKEFLKATATFVCYGGARGGGKSWALDFKCCCMAANYPGIKTIIIRKSQKDVKKNHYMPLKEMIGSSAKWSETDLCFKWNNGSIIQFGYADTIEDLSHLQGQEYQIVCVEEATQFTYDEFAMIFAICRGGDESWPKRVYLTCNPGGVGHAWVKRLFIDRQFLEDENPDDYKFIQAFVTDNSHNGKDYIQKLKLQPDNVKSGWLYGNWDVVAGQFFTEWKKEIHVVNPFPIPYGWRHYFTMDYGRDMLAAYWIAVNSAGMAFVYDEIYIGNDLEKDTGLIVSEAAEKIQEHEKRNKCNDIFIRIAPPDLWSKQSSTGKSTAEIFADCGICLTKSDNDRINGWYSLREWLKVYKDSATKKETTRLKIFSTCHNLIRVFPLLQYDTKRPNDAAKIPHEYTHAPDALRYWAISRPFGSMVSEPERHFDFDEMQEEYERSKHPLRGYIGGEVTSSYLNYGG